MPKHPQFVHRYRLSNQSRVNGLTFKEDVLKLHASDMACRDHTCLLLQAIAANHPLPPLQASTTGDTCSPLQSTHGQHICLLEHTLPQTNTAHTIAVQHSLTHRIGAVQGLTLLASLHKQDNLNKAKCKFSSCANAT